MSAQDKASGKSQKITITSDKGRLSEEEIARMIREAEENAEADKQLREGVEARNQLESYLYSLRTTIDETFKDKIEAADKEAVQKVVTEGLTWLESHPTGTKEEFDDKRKEVEAVASPIISKVYQATGGGPSHADSNSNSEDGSAADGSGSGDSSSTGPTVEEVD